jgi:fatty acid desaturase
MIENNDNLELSDRLSLIESMISEGRRTTESWGWTFVLWGVAYYVAIGWSAVGSSQFAWPVTMIAAFLITWIIAARKSGSHPSTTIGRAMSAIWISMGISMFTLLLSLGMSGHYSFNIFVAIIGAMLGCSNATSSIILKWKAQFASAIVWWLAAIAACFGNEQQCLIAFLVALFLCQIVFGIYAMMADAKRQKRNRQHSSQQGGAHA